MREKNEIVKMSSYDYAKDINVMLNNIDITSERA
jgi:hypothetical protein